MSGIYGRYAMHILLVVPTFLGLNDPGCWRGMAWRRHCPPSFSKRRATGVKVSFHNRIIGNFIVYQDRIGRNLLKVCVRPENSDWFSIISFIMSTLLLNRNKHICKDFLFVSYKFKSPSTLLLLPLRYRCSVVKQTFWALQNFWPIIVCQLFYFS